MLHIELQFYGPYYEPNPRTPIMTTRFGDLNKQCIARDGERPFL